MADESRMKKIRMMIPLSKLSPSDFNPPGRTTVGATRQLKAEIEREGVLQTLHVIGRKESTSFPIVDGHRRYAVAQAIGIAELECVVYDVPLDAAGDLWSTLSSSRQVTTFEWTYAWYHNENVRPPTRVVGHIRNAETVFGGRAGIKYLLDNKVDPSITVQIGSLHHALSSRPSLGKPRPKKYLGEWMIRHHMRGMVQQLLRGVPSLGLLRKLRARIEADKPLLPSELVAGSRGVT